MTDGGLGVAFFSPFHNTRYFLPWMPIRVSPIGVSRFFSQRGLEALQSELLWIWLPSALLMRLAYLRGKVRDGMFANRVTDACRTNEFPHELCYLQALYNQHLQRPPVSIDPIELTENSSPLESALAKNRVPALWAQVGHALQR